MTRCSICNCEINPNEVRTAFEDVYCEECFNENYNYCQRCDEIISRDNTNWDDDGNAYCNECYENQFDEDCPQNPDVYDSDRKYVLQLSRNWLSGNCNHKTLIKINTNDFLLQKLKDMTGLIDQTIYVFGLQDREDYQISASPNIIEDVREFVMLSGYDYKVTEGIGCNRLGVSHSLRKDNLQLICKLIKDITTVNELITV